MKARLGGLGFVVFSLAYGWAAQGIESLPVDAYEVMSARTLPNVLSIVGVILGAIMALSPTRELPVEGRSEPGGWLIVVALLAGIVGYALALPWLGFVGATSLFLIAGFALLGERRPWVLLVASVAPVLALWLILVVGLGVYLTPGRLTGL